VDCIQRMSSKTYRRTRFDRFGRRLRMPKAKRNIDREIPHGVREIKRGQHGRVVTLPHATSSNAFELRSAMSSRVRATPDATPAPPNPSCSSPAPNSTRAAKPVVQLAHLTCHRGLGQSPPGAGQGLTFRTTKKRTAPGIPTGPPRGSWRKPIRSVRLVDPSWNRRPYRYSFRYR
jgi:hypothetical protein